MIKSRTSREANEEVANMRNATSEGYKKTDVGGLKSGTWVFEVPVGSITNQQLVARFQSHP